MTTATLAALAVLLSGPGPALLARAPALRRTPRAAMTLWQAVALAAVLSTLGAGLALVTDSTLPATESLARYVVAVIALVVTGIVLGRMLLSGHLVGTRIRSLRRRHRELVDLLSSRQAGVHVLDHEVPVAYCLPGLRSRVVLSAGTMSRLAPDELAALLAHERAHLRARHDLVLEAFTVLYEAFPRFVSSRVALAEVELLVEVLADRAALHRTDRAPLARALLAVAQGRTPDAGLAAAGSSLVERVALLSDDRPHRMQAAVLFGAAILVVVLPTVVAYPWLSGLV